MTIGLCDKVRDKHKDSIERIRDFTQKTHHEAGFFMCRNGKSGTYFHGDEKGMKMLPIASGCDENQWDGSIHTHPEDKSPRNNELSLYPSTTNIDSAHEWTIRPMCIVSIPLNSLMCLPETRQGKTAQLKDLIAMLEQYRVPDEVYTLTKSLVDKQMKTLKACTVSLD